MKFINVSTGIVLAKSALLAFAAVIGKTHLTHLGVAGSEDTLVPRSLEKRDAFTCYGHGANVTDCRGALDQINQLGDEKLQVFSGICLNWAHDSCNIRFCAQPYVTYTINRTASWISAWVDHSLMGCVKGGHNAIMGDSINLDGDGGTYRLYLEHTTPTHT